MEWGVMPSSDTDGSPAVNDVTASSIFQHSTQMEGKPCPRPCHMPWIATIHPGETEPVNKTASTDGPTLFTHTQPHRGVILRLTASNVKGQK